MPVPASSIKVVKPFANLLVVPFDQTIQSFIFNMEEKTLINLNISVWGQAKIMAVFIAIYLIKITSKVIDATHAHFPWAEDAIPNLRGNGQTEIVARHAATNSATIGELTLHIRCIRDSLCRDLT